MYPEVAEAIRITDRHLAGGTPEQKSALAKDIVRAVTDHAQRMVEEMLGKSQKPQ